MERTVSMNITLGRGVMEISIVLPNHPSEKSADFTRVSEMGNIHLLFVYHYMVAQWICLQIIPVPNKMMLNITTIFPSQSSSKLALRVYGCLVPSKFWYMGSFLIKHPSFKEIKTVQKSSVDWSLKIWDVLWGVLGVDHKAHFRNI